MPSYGGIARFIPIAQLWAATSETAMIGDFTAVETDWTVGPAII